MDFAPIIHEHLGSPSSVMKISEASVSKIQQDFERDLLTYLLSRYHGNQCRTASNLGINRNTLRKKIAKHQIDAGAMRALYTGHRD